MTDAILIELQDDQIYIILESIQYRVFESVKNQIQRLTFYQNQLCFWIVFSSKLKY